MGPAGSTASLQHRDINKKKKDLHNNILKRFLNHWLIFHKESEISFKIAGGLDHVLSIG